MDILELVRNFLHFLPVLGVVLLVIKLIHIIDNHEEKD